MKQLAIFMPNMNMGGAQVSLIELLREIDKTKYDVTLYLFNKNGVLIQKVPKDIKVEYLCDYYSLYSNKYGKSLKQDLLKSVLKFDLKYTFSKLKAYKKYKSLYNLHDEQKIWEIVKDRVENISIDADICISYMQGSTTYFLVDKVKTNAKKYAMVNTNYEKAKYNKEYDSYYFEKLDKIACVSQESTNILQSTFSRLKNKIYLVEDVFSKDYVRQLAKQNLYEKDSTFTFVACARLAIDVKGYDFLVEVANKLKNNGYKFKWLILGDGSGRQWLENKIEQYDLKNYVILMGDVINPYPYIKKSDCLTQLSRFEGKGRSIIEAKTLGVPVVSTNFEAAKEEIQDGFNGYLVDMSIDSIYDCLSNILNNPNQLEYIRKNISVNESSGIENYYNFFES